MISGATKRSIIRVVHLVLSIPVLGYIYGEPAEVQEYASAVRYVFVPVIILSGFWMSRAPSSPSSAWRYG